MKGDRPVLIGLGVEIVVAEKLPDAGAVIRRAEQERAAFAAPGAAPPKLGERAPPQPHGQAHGLDRGIRRQGSLRC